MTLKDKVREIVPLNIDDQNCGGVFGCPYNYDFLKGHYDNERRKLICKDATMSNTEKCKYCWDEKYIENSDSNEDIVPEEKKEVVNHPSHYQGKNECIDVMIAMFGVEAVKHFCMCNAYKYRFRSNAKNGEEDIRKAEWYESKLIELNSEPNGK